MANPHELDGLSIAWWGQYPGLSLDLQELTERRVTVLSRDEGVKVMFLPLADNACMEMAKKTPQTWYTASYEWAERVGIIVFEEIRRHRGLGSVNETALYEEIDQDQWVLNGLDSLIPIAGKRSLMKVVLRWGLDKGLAARVDIEDGPVARKMEQVGDELVYTNLDWGVNLRLRLAKIDKALKFTLVNLDNFGMEWSVPCGVDEVYRALKVIRQCNQGRAMTKKDWRILAKAVEQAKWPLLEV